MGASVGNKGFVAEINVTPFVDVMLVLLIIFMVTAPMLTEGLEVDLPVTEAVETLPVDDQNNVLLTVRKDGVIFLNEYDTSMDTLAQTLKTTVSDTGKRLFLQADKDVPYGTVVAIMGRVKAAGIEQMGIVAERIDDIMPPSTEPSGVAPSMPGSPGQPSARASGR